MTLRVKPTTKPRRRSSWQSEERSQFSITIGFIVVIALTLLALVGAVGADYYNKHLKTVASVGGAGIDVDQWAERANLLAYRINRAERRIREAIAANEIDPTTGSTQISELQTKRQSAPGDALDQLINQLLQARLATEMGISATEQDIDAALQRETTSTERRKVQAIFVEPKAAEVTQAPTIADQETALANAQKALADLAGGKTFAEVAAQYSTDASKDRGGEYGTLTQSNTTDAAWVEALFRLESGNTTEIVKGADGTYRIGRVTEMIPGAEDPTYLEELQKEGMSTAAFRKHLGREVVSDKLVEKVVADALAGDKDQVRLAEIYIALAEPTEGEEAPTDEGQVKVRHILYSPKDDPQGAADLPAEDPAWRDGGVVANAAADKVRAIGDLVAREAEFGKLAKAESDDTGSGATRRPARLHGSQRLRQGVLRPDLRRDPQGRRDHRSGEERLRLPRHLLAGAARPGGGAHHGHGRAARRTPPQTSRRWPRSTPRARAPSEGGILGWSTKDQAGAGSRRRGVRAAGRPGDRQGRPGRRRPLVQGPGEGRSARSIADQRSRCSSSRRRARISKAFVEWYDRRSSTRRRRTARSPVTRRPPAASDRELDEIDRVSSSRRRTDPGLLRELESGMGWRPRMGCSYCRQGRSSGALRPGLAGRRRAGCDRARGPERGGGVVVGREAHGDGPAAMLRHLYPASPPRARPRRRLGIHRRRADRRGARGWLLARARAHRGAQHRQPARPAVARRSTARARRLPVGSRAGPPSLRSSCSRRRTRSTTRSTRAPRRRWPRSSATCCSRSCSTPSTRPRTACSTCATCYAT